MRLAAPLLFQFGAMLLIAREDIFGQSPPRLSIRLSPDEVSWSSQTNETYQMQFSSSLSVSNWSNLGGLIRGNGNTNHFVLPAPGAAQQAFYRITASTNSFKRWPSSDVRLDTTHGYTVVAVDQPTFSNIVGMPVLQQLYVNRFENLQTNSGAGGYNFDSYRGYKYQDKFVSEDVASNAYLSVAECAFIRNYYPQFFNSQKPSLPDWYAAFRAYSKTVNPAQVVGGYISGSFCVDRPDVDFYPKDGLDSHAVNPAGHSGFAYTYKKFDETNDDSMAAWFVDPTDTPNITNMQNALLTEAIARNVDFLWFDNMQQISYGSNATEFVTAYITNLGQICAKLNANGYGAVFNLGKLPGWPIDFGANSNLYEGSFDAAIGDNGVYVEQSFRYRDDWSLTQAEFQSRRTLLKQGAMTALSPSPQGYNVLSAVEWTAAMAMIMRETGDSIFVVTDVNLNNSTNAWKDWPGLYGPPASAIHFGNLGNTNWFYYRQFSRIAGSEITAAHIGVPETWPSTNSLPPGISLSGYQLIPGREPKRGTWDNLQQVYVVNQDPGLDCSQDGGFSDSFVLGKNQLIPLPAVYQGIIAVDVLFAHAPCPP